MTQLDQGNPDRVVSPAATGARPPITAGRNGRTLSIRTAHSLAGRTREWRARQVFVSRYASQSLVGSTTGGRARYEYDAVFAFILDGVHTSRVCPQVDENDFTTRQLVSRLPADPARRRTLPPA